MGAVAPMSPRPTPRRKVDPIFLIATWFGCGLSPIAPGTAGSLAAVVIGVALQIYTGAGRGTFLLLAVILCIPGIWAAGIVAQRENRIDPHIVVVDEVIGQWITIAGASTLNWKSWTRGVLAFSIARCLETAAGASIRELPGRLGHRRRRRDGGHLRRACYILIRPTSSLLIYGF